MPTRHPIALDSLSLGIFVKTDSPQITELLGTTGLDFVVVDAEHAPMDRMVVDRHVMAARATGIPVLIRLPDHSATGIQSALDLGVDGILIPRVDDAGMARQIVARSKFGNGGTRGFSISPRFSRYGGTSMADAVTLGDASLVLCQIESVGGLANVEAIAAVPGVDGLFIGRADLALSMGRTDIRSSEVTEACMRIVRAARNCKKVAAMFVPSSEEAVTFAAHGVTCFVVGSDQALLRNAAQVAASQREAVLRALAAHAAR